MKIVNFIDVGGIEIINIYYENGLEISMLKSLWDLQQENAELEGTL